MRTVLHADINSCYASIETIRHPEYRDIPMAVGGEEALRHGIILAKNELAKKAGIRTGEALWQARAKCPQLLIVPPDYTVYMEYCRRAHDMYLQYTDMVESFGPDECWLDVTGSSALFGAGVKIADELRQRMKEELGLSISVGVSWNKVFAKFGSDYRKPDATTLITPENYRDIVWQAPAGDLLYVGQKTAKKLASGAIFTIGDIARSTPEHMRNALGKLGAWLHLAANGLDTSPVMRYFEEEPIRSVGNSATPPRDICNEEDARLLLYVLADSIARRMREKNLCCTGVQLHLRDTELSVCERQMQFNHRVTTAYELCAAGMELLTRTWDFSRPLRSLGLRGINLCVSNGETQLSMFAEERRIQRKEMLEQTADKIRDRYGSDSLCRAAQVHTANMRG